MDFLKEKPDQFDLNTYKEDIDILIQQFNMNKEEIIKLFQETIEYFKSSKILDYARILIVKNVKEKLEIIKEVA